MKTLNKIFLLAICTVVLTQHVLSQEYKHAVGDKKQVVIQQLLGKIILEESTSSELVVMVDEFENVLPPEKAKGLKVISPSGLQDNTGIGLNIKSDGNVLIISGVSKRTADGQYIIKIPKGINCKIDYKSPFAKEDIHITGFSSELEVSTMNSDISLEQVTGPLLLNSINGNITVNFSQVNQKTPTSITTINGEVDITMPTNTGAQLSMSSIQGEIYTDFDIEIKNHNKKDGLTFIGGGHDVKGSINDGGVDIQLKTINDNIYLRKK